MNRYTAYVFNRRSETEQTVWGDSGFAVRKALASQHNVPVTDCISIRDGGGIKPDGSKQRG